jgi:alkylhydroperoxidase family enzyme
VSWVAAAADTTHDLDGVFGLLPEAYERFLALYESLWESAVLEPSILDMCRLRIAALMGLDATDSEPGTIALSLAADKLATLPRYATSPLFSTCERACIEFAEQYVLDPHALTDEDFARLREHLDDKQIATLTLAAAVFDATTRFELALGIAPHGSALR